MPLTLLVAPLLDPLSAAGLIGVAIVPAPLFAPALVRLAGGRSDMTGALGLGTIVASFALVVLREDVAGLAATAAQAFVGAALVANALPPLRDRFLAPLRWAGDIAVLVVLGAAAVSGPDVGAEAVAVAFGALVLTTGMACVAARALGRDVLSALAGAGSRDPALAVALAWSMQGPFATSVPLLYGAGLALAAAVIVRRR